VENWFPYWRSWPGRIGEELEAQGFASPSIMVVAEVVAQRVEAQRVEACAPEPADTELPIPF
jgi:uroporphyrin-III C-methyltransferase